MITLQRIALTLMTSPNQLYTDLLFERIPWISLSDALRRYVGRPAIHFEETPDETDTSWIEFPNGENLSNLNEENVGELVEYYISSKVSECVIGERTNISEFDKRNYYHPFYHLLRIPILQDCVLDEVLRERLVDVEGRFDDKFVVRHNRSIVLDGAQLRQQITKFEEIGFLHLAGKVYKKSGIVLSQEWFENNVYKVLKDKRFSPYPEFLAENTCKYMRVPEWIDDRIWDLNFSLTDEDKNSIFLTDELERVLDEMYAEAYRQTAQELALSF